MNEYRPFCLSPNNNLLRWTFCAGQTTHRTMPFEVSMTEANSSISNHADTFERDRESKDVKVDGN